MNFVPPGQRPIPPVFRLRQQCLPDIVPLYAGYAAWRASVLAAHDFLRKRCSTVLAGPGQGRAQSRRTLLDQHPRVITIEHGRRAPGERGRHEGHTRIVMLDDQGVQLDGQQA